jgi:hypothetical protein
METQGEPVHGTSNSAPGKAEPESTLNMETQGEPVHGTSNSAPGKAEPESTHKQSAFGARLALTGLAPLAQTAEHFHGKEGVYGSIP